MNASSEVDAAAPQESDVKTGWGDVSTSSHKKKPPAEEKRDLQIGDVVQLRSGGPNMTVVNHKFPNGDKHDVQTRWFNKEGIWSVTNFDPRELKVVREYKG